MGEVRALIVSLYSQCSRFAAKCRVEMRRREEEYEMMCCVAAKKNIDMRIGE